MVNGKAVYIKIINIIIFIFFSLNIYAETGSVTGFELPRFVSLKSNDVNLRVGPSINYPIKIKYIQKNLPVQIIDEFDVWRKIQDHKNNIGWIHKGLIKGDRFILTINKNENVKNIYNRPNGKIVGIIKSNNILNLEHCLVDWCYISHIDISGWISKDFIWGIYKDEIYNKSIYQPIINQYWKFLESKFAKYLKQIIFKD